MVQDTRRYDRFAQQYSPYRPCYPEPLMSHLAAHYRRARLFPTATYAAMGQPGRGA
jgi:hypothetical protein